MENDFDFAFYLCNDCAATYGDIPATVLVPDEVFWKRVQDAQIEKYGRMLNADELAVELEDGRSFMSKLAKEKP